MKGLATLLRLSTTRTEHLRSTLAAATEHRVRVAEDLERNQAERVAESRVQGITGEALQDWSRWHAAAQREEASLRDSLDTCMVEEERHREAMRDSIADGKRLELALASRIRAARIAAARRAEAAAEDAALRRPTATPPLADPVPGAG